MSNDMSSANRFGWIKRRARRLQRFYGIQRRLAIHDAWMDWILFRGVSATGGSA